MIYVLSGGNTKLFAAIGVTYPEGSTCTCTDGVKSFTAKDTSGQWIFNIPYVGTWTVTATDGTDTESETVEITAQWQNVTVELKYFNGELYNNGTLHYPFTAIGASAQDGSTARVPTVSYEQTKVTINLAYSMSAGVWRSDLVDLTDYTTLSLAYNGVTQENGRNRLFVTTDPTCYKWRSGGSTVTSANLYVSGPASIDISNLSGEYYVCVGVSTSGVANATVQVSHLWME